MALKQIAISVIIPIAVAAILIVPWAALQRSYAQSDIADTILKIHNDERAAVAATPRIPELKWSDSLAADAKSYAEELMKLDQGKYIDELPPSPHSTSSDGENLADSMKASSSGEVSPPSTASLVQQWVKEKEYWKGGTFASPESCQVPGKAAGKGCGHYTQMVWRTTTDVGCGTATLDGKTSSGLSGKVFYLVCRYSPPGNWIGKMPY
jgi:pathogenesis-related protein 1